MVLSSLEMCNGHVNGKHSRVGKHNAAARARGSSK